MIVYVGLCAVSILLAIGALVLLLRAVPTIRSIPPGAERNTLLDDVMGNVVYLLGLAVLLIIAAAVVRP